MAFTCRIKPLWVSSSPLHLLRKGGLRFKLPFEMFSFSGLFPLKSSSELPLGENSYFLQSRMFTFSCMKR